MLHLRDATSAFQDQQDLSQEEDLNLLTLLKERTSQLAQCKAALDRQTQRGDALQAQLDVIRRGQHIDLGGFFHEVVPDFTPLGGNRPECAIVACAAAVSVFDHQSHQHNDDEHPYQYPYDEQQTLPPADDLNNRKLLENGRHNHQLNDKLNEYFSHKHTYKPDDVIACAIYMLCAPETLTLTAEWPLLMAKGSVRFRGTIRLENDAAVDRLCSVGGGLHGGGGLPPMTTPPLPHQQPPPATSYVTAAFNPWEQFPFNTRGGGLASVCFHLADTITAIGNDFLRENTAITELDLWSSSSSGGHLTSLGVGFLAGCHNLEWLGLPSSITTLVGGEAMLLQISPKLLEIKTNSPAVRDALEQLRMTHLLCSEDLWLGV